MQLHDERIAFPRLVTDWIEKNAFDGNAVGTLPWANPNITAYAVEVTEYPDLARRYHVTGVPKTIVDETIEILGAVPEEEFISLSLTATPQAPTE